jgi:hypothetical protein
MNLQFKNNLRTLLLQGLLLTTDQLFLSLLLLLLLLFNRHMLPLLNPYIRAHRLQTLQISQSLLSMIPTQFSPLLMDLLL